MCACCRPKTDSLTDNLAKQKEQEPPRQEPEPKKQEPPPPPEPEPPPPPEPTEEEIRMSHLMYPKPGELGIVWGDKVICVLETGLPELYTRWTQTEESDNMSTQTYCQKCAFGPEFQIEAKQLIEPEPEKQVQFQTEAKQTEAKQFTEPKEQQFTKPEPREQLQRSFDARFSGNVHQMGLEPRRLHTMPTHQVRVHHLNRDENKETTLYRLEKGWVLRFLLGPSLHSALVRLFCNHPPDENISFDRHVYHELEWHCPTGMRSDLTDVYADVKIICSGSFNYFFTIDESVDISKANGQGYFLVDPTLSVGQDEEITMDCLQVQTVISKLLGSFSGWEGKLAVARESGYNMIHFTPVQELGISNSAYSIRNQHILSPVYSKGESTKYVMEDLEKLVKKMHNEWRVLSLTDLVFNHTSKDSPWVLENPDCTYNLKNSPHLRPAYIVDCIFRCFSEEVAEGLWEDKGVPTEVSREEHLQAMRQVLHTQVFPKYKISEFYTCNHDVAIKEFKRAIDENRRTSSAVDEVKIKQDNNYGRNQCCIDIDEALNYFNTDRKEELNQRASTLQDTLEALFMIKAKPGNFLDVDQQHSDASLEKLKSAC